MSAEVFADILPGIPENMHPEVPIDIPAGVPFDFFSTSPLINCSKGSGISLGVFCNNLSGKCRKFLL